MKALLSQCQSSSWKLVLLMLLISSNIYGSDITTLSSRLKEFYLGSLSPNATYMSTMNSDGSWSNINYASVSMAYWEPINHLARLKYMSVAYNTPSHSYYMNSNLLSRIEDGLAYWYKVKPESDNWWHNEISQPQQIMKILILMHPYLKAETVNTGTSYLVLPDRYVTETGQNKIWFSEIVIHKGVINENVGDINTGISGIGSTLKLMPEGEGGIRPDFCFQQHYELLYNGGYGLSYVDDASFWVYFTRGLSFTFSDDEIDVLSNYLLEGMQWMTYKGDIDYLSTGRELVRSGRLDDASALLKPLNYLVEMKGVHTDEFVAYIDHIKGGINNKVGNKHFWYSDYHVHRRKDFVVSVKMWSKRTIGTEYVNGENSEGYFLSCGAMYIEEDKGSYFNIQPVWDWCMLPGVTCAKKEAPPRTVGYMQAFYGETDFVGGVTDSLYGVASMDLSADNTRGKKSWFFFDDEIVALGAGIESTNSENIVTTLNQEFLNGSVYSFSSEEKVYDKGVHTLDLTQWVYHDDIAYVFPEPCEVKMKNTSQSGSWYEVNQNYSNAEITEDVFSLWIDHGVQPENASYYYVIVPAIEKQEVNDYVNNISISLIQNTSDIQAVKNESLNITGIVFHKAGELALNNEIKLSVNNPCVLLLDERNSVLTAANPNQTNMDLNVELTYGDNSIDKILFSFHDGDYAGKSIQKLLSVDSCSGFSVEGVSSNSDSGLDNGRISLTVSGGVLPIKYEWNDGSISKDREGLSAGSYLVTVTDSINCSVTKSFLVEENSIEINNVNVVEGVVTTEFSISGDCSNVTYILFDESNNVLYSPETDVQSGFTFDIAEVCSACDDGMYNIGVFCGNNSDKSSFNYTSPVIIDPCLSFTVTGISNNADYGEDNGIITIRVSGGSEPYSFSWSDGVNTQNRDNLGVGSYTVDVFDDNKVCTKSLTFTIEEDPIPFKIIKYFPTSTDNIVAIEYTSPIASTVEVVVESITGEYIKGGIVSCKVGKNKETIGIAYDDDNNPILNGSYYIIIKQAGKTDKVEVKKR